MEGKSTVGRRFELTDEQWDRIAHLLPGKKTDPGVTAADNRLFLDAVLWIARTGAPWRDLPLRFGKWNSVFQRFNRWCDTGVWTRVFQALQDPDLEYLVLDSTVVRAHQHAAGAKRQDPNPSPTPGQDSRVDDQSHDPSPPPVEVPARAEAEAKTADQALGRSRGGFSTKIHVAVDALGNPVRILLSGGQAHDVTYGPALIEGLPAELVMGDKGYDSDSLVEKIEGQGAIALIPPRKNRKTPRSYDKHIYKERNVVERFINKIKQCRRVATRYEKKAANYLGFTCLAASMILLA